VLKSIVSQLTKNFFKGLGISHMSLPVKMFEPRSTLQRLVDSISFAPIFMNKAVETTDPLERFKYVIATTVAGLHLCTG
jgi:hypothetical protein